MLTLTWLAQRHLTLFLVTLNLAAFALFLIIRAPSERLAERDAQAAHGDLSITSGEPIYIADRAVWGVKSHGTGHMSSLVFDAYFLANVPSFFVASYAGNAVSPYLARYVLRSRVDDRFFSFMSWVTAALFVPMSILQWFATGFGLSSLVSRRLRKRQPRGA